jgi:RND family efflux transporter MFP subunit
MSLRYPVFSWLVLIALLFAAGCGKSANTFVEPPPPEVTVQLPIEQEVVESLDLPGTAKAIESVDVRARVQGFLEKINFKDGAHVKAGDVLFEIDPKQYQAEYDRCEASLAEAKAKAKRTEADFSRAKELMPKNAIAQSDYDLAASSYAEALASVRMAEANVRAAKLNLDYTKVVAPISGRASRRLVDVGNLVGATDKTLLTTIVNDDSIYVYANVSESDFLALMRQYPRGRDKSPSKDDKKPIALMGLADEVGYPHVGEIEFFDNKVDPETGTLQIRAKFPNDHNMLMGGLFVRLRFPTGVRKTMLVPDLAVLADQSGRYVLVVDDKGVVEQRPVTVGKTHDNKRVIEKGLSPTDRVVINGLQKARPGTKVKPTVALAPKKAVESEKKK